MEDQQIGSYRILKKIGAGGMAKVYLAVHRDVPNLKVILKILSNPRLAERFKQEADKLALLDGHPNICRIKHFFSHKENTVIAMEYIDGVTLEDRIKSEGLCPIDESLQIISDVLNILDFAHQKGIYHRDIKPGNIMLDRQGQVKIIDFGIAKAKTDPNLTMAGTACGTPAYMAPEQFTPAEDTDYALVDVYATGTSLYVMLTGQVPFSGDNEFAIRDAKLFSAPPPPSSLNPNIPRSVEQLILKSLAKEPQQRFQSAREMQTAVDDVRHGTRAGDRPDPSGITIDIRQSNKLPGKSKMPWLIGAALILVAAAAAYYFLARGPSAEGTLAFSVIPEGDVYVDDSLIGQSISSASVICAAGRHIVHVRNAEATVAVLGDTVMLEKDTILTLRYDFSSFIPPPMGTLEINVDPWGDVYVDDSLVADSTTSVDVACEVGDHSVRVENNRATRRTRQETVSLAADTVLRLTYNFTFPAADKPQVTEQDPAPAAGEVRIGSRPAGADVYIDGKKQSLKTINTFWLLPGNHTISVRLDNQGWRADTTLLVKGDSLHLVSYDFLDR
ncbi:MAG: protein kinase [bacterium]